MCERCSITRLIAERYGTYSAGKQRLVEAGRVAYDEAASIAIYRSIHRHLLTDHPTIFICREPVMYAVRQPLRGLEAVVPMGIFRSLPAWYWAP